jgi:thiol-disulfide isomerase/thioredoxin
MKTKIAVILGVAMLLISGGRALCADATEELKALVTKVQADIKAGKTTEPQLADDLKQFDVLLAQHKGEKTDAVAQILVMKAMLYVEVLDDQEKGIALLKQVKTDYPDTKPAAQVDKILAMLEQQAGAKKIQSALKVGAQFPDFNVTGVDGKPLSVAALKGKVVLIDFWATWCGPCREELPNVLAAYKKYHAKGFDIIGVSLDQDRAKLTSFTESMGMKWPQFFDGNGWSNQLAVKYGIESIPATFLLDGQGKIIGKNLRGEALDAALVKALPKS